MRSKKETRSNYQLSTFRRTRLCKTIAFILTFTFILYDITWAQGGAPLWSHSKPDIKQTEQVEQYDIKVPYEAGKVQKTYINGSNEVIVNIKDVHDSLSAQYSIVKILDDLASNYDMRLIALEAAQGPVDTSLLKTYPNPEVKKETAHYLMQKGKMSAGEFYSIVSEKPVKLYGVEDDSHYKANVKAVEGVMEIHLECIKNIDNLLFNLKSLEGKIFSKDLAKLVKNEHLHKKGKLAFNDHWQFIKELAKKYAVEIVVFENLSKLLKSIELEKEIDFRRVNEERKRLIDTLSTSLSKLKLEKLIRKSLAFKEGKLSQAGFHEYLTGLALEAKLPPEDFKNLILFTRHISIYEEVDLMTLFEELQSIENFIADKIFKRDDEKTLYNLILAIKIMKRLFSLSISSKEFETLEKKEAKSAWLLIKREATAMYIVLTRE